jgi:hypothetical protein
MDIVFIIEFTRTVRANPACVKLCRIIFPSRDANKWWNTLYDLDGQIEAHRLPVASYYFSGLLESFFTYSLHFITVSVSWKVSSIRGHNLPLLQVRPRFVQ